MNTEKNKTKQQLITEKLLSPYKPKDDGITPMIYQTTDCNDWIGLTYDISQKIITIEVSSSIEYLDQDDEVITGVINLREDDALELARSILKIYAKDM